MTRHGKNCTANSVYSYHERRRDAKSSGWGNLKERLTKDALKEFDCCSLMLQPCKTPVITPDGCLFDKEAILEYYLQQKKLIADKTAAWKMAKQTATEDITQEEDQTHSARMDRLLAPMATPCIRQTDEDDGAATTSGQTDAQTQVVQPQPHKRKLASFWTPAVSYSDAKKSKTSAQEVVAAVRPEQKVRNPIDGSILKIKDLISIKFTPIPDDDGRPDVGKIHRYMCPITRDLLTNSVECVVLRPTGDVITNECFEKLIKGADWKHPLTGEKLVETDIIPLQRGGTGYAQTNATSLKATLIRPMLELQ